jgi:hypothetical protein
MDGIEKFLAKRLKLRVNKAKSAVAKPSVRKFLGFSFTSGKEPRRRIARGARYAHHCCVRGLDLRARRSVLACTGLRQYLLTSVADICQVRFHALCDAPGTQLRARTELPNVSAACFPDGGEL